MVVGGIMSYVVILLICLLSPLVMAWFYGPIWLLSYIALGFIFSDPFMRDPFTIFMLGKKNTKEE